MREKERERDGGRLVRCANDDEKDRGEGETERKGERERGDRGDAMVREKRRERAER